MQAVVACAMCAQSCLTLCDPMDCEPTRLLCPWNFPGKNPGVVAISLSRGSSPPRDQTHVSCTGRQILYCLATWEGTMEDYLP